MAEFINDKTESLARQANIRAKCFHPAGNFVEFTNRDLLYSIPTHFERQVAKAPDHLALRSKRGEFSYRDLNKFANRVARAVLSEHGATPEPVALLLGHDGIMVGSLLGVMKAGKICVPLESASPLARIRSVLEDVRAGVILTDSDHAEIAAQLTDGKRRIIDVGQLQGRYADDNIDLVVSPDALAFILYTSGSTGQPKGVPQPHRNALHSAMAYINGLHIEADDRVTLLGSCSGGQGMKIMISALVSGAAVFPWNIAEEGLAHLSDWLIAEGITVYISGAAVFRSVTATLTGEEKFPALRIVRVGNEPIHQSDVELYRKYFSPECIFVNWFALTEAGNVACYFIDKQTPNVDEFIPIGYPFADTQIAVLDEGGRSLRFNQAGQIAIRSRFLSPGYWHQPDLTKTKFLATDGDERTFLSGDLGMMLSDGLLHYAGREDFQVKIRGNRLELGEVEAALLALDDIRDAVVLSQRRGMDTHLVAYLVAAGATPPTPTMIRSTLAEQLPQHMIPSVFIFLDALPVTANGKVDRGALPTPQLTRSVSPMLPHTPLEEAIAKIWADALGLAQVGIHDNFFELGGHSLNANQIVVRVIKHFGIEIPLQSLFKSPTIAAMADVISQSQGRKLEEKEINRILTELETLTEAEAERLNREEATKK